MTKNLTPIESHHLCPADDLQMEILCFIYKQLNSHGHTREMVCGNRILNFDSLYVSYVVVSVGRYITKPNLIKGYIYTVKHMGTILQ